PGVERQLGLKFLLCFVCFGAGLGHDVFDLYGLAALALRFVGGFHEGHQFDRLFGGNGGLFGFEEFGDLIGEGLVAFEADLGADALGAEDDDAVVVFAGAEASEGADAVVVPDAGDELAAVLFAAAGGDAGDGLAA